MADSNYSLLHTLVIYCQEGQLFYQGMAKLETNLAMTSMFRELSLVRMNAVDELSDISDTTYKDFRELGEPVSTMLDLYSDMTETAQEGVPEDALFQLDVLETSILLWLGEGVRELEDSSLADTMAKHIASMHMSHDSLRDLRVDLK